MLLDRLVAQYRNALARTHREVLDLDSLGDEASYDAQVAASLAKGEPPAASGSASSPAGCAATPRCASCSSACGPS